MCWNPFTRNIQSHRGSKACVKSLNSIARTAGVHIMLYKSVHPSVRPPKSVSEIAHNSFDQIMHHSARNDQFAFHTCLMAPRKQINLRSPRVVHITVS